MSLTTYSIKHFNNTIDVFESNQKKYTSKWFMDFGKFCSEVFTYDEKLLYSITKKFKFWKWKMVYTIKSDKNIITELISLNNKKTIHAIVVNDITYEILIHYKKRISIFKNEEKIAEFDESFSDENYKESIKLLLLDKNDLEISFLLYSCIKIGETEPNKKAILTSQKQLEVNQDPWN